MKRMLINATQSEERRLAIVDGQKLLDYESEIEGREQRKSNIYKAVITRVEPSLEACFIDYGEERHGFLPFREISKQYFQNPGAQGQYKIQDQVKEGQSLLVQVEKEERGNKGAALTTFISLAGRYVVLMPNSSHAGGVSRRIEGEYRAELKENLEQLEYPSGMSIIARTAGIGRSAQELQWDLNYLLKLWQAIEEAAQNGKGAFLIYQESSLVIRAMRDYFHTDISDILIDADDIYEQAKQFMGYVMPEYAARIKRYRDEAALFSRFQIEHQIESAYSRMVQLPSGGSIVIDRTEALVAIDVNSARAIKGSHIEDTALNTNLEAVDEIARQMRLRDLGGLLVVDFIDMEEIKNRREVEQRLREVLRQDRARIQFSTISKFGLLELSRQRLRPTLSEGASIPCPRCGGGGHIRDTESAALQILRVIQEESMKDNTAAVHVQVPVEVASFLLNEKRAEITKIELQQRIRVTMVPSKQLETPNYQLERLKHDDPRLETLGLSYQIVEVVKENTAITRHSKDPTNKQEPVIKGILPDTPAPPSTTKVPAHAVAADLTAIVQPGLGLWNWIKRLFNTPEPPTTADETPSRSERNPQVRSTRRGKAAAVATPKTQGQRTQKRETSRKNDSKAENKVNPTGTATTRAAGNTEDRSSKGANATSTDTRSKRKVQSDAEAQTPNANIADTKQRRGRGKRAAEPAKEAVAPETSTSDDTQTNSLSNNAEATFKAGSKSRDRYRRDRRGQHTQKENAGSQVVADSDVQESTAALTADEGKRAPVAKENAEAKNAEAKTQDSLAHHSSALAHAQVDNTPAESSTTTFKAVEATTTPVATATPANTSVAPSATGEDAVDTKNNDHNSNDTTAMASKELPAYDLPTQTLATLVHTSGLHWVQSDPQKIALARSQIQPEVATPVSSRGLRQSVPVDTTPLVMVETRKNLAQPSQSETIASYN